MTDIKFGRDKACYARFSKKNQKSELNKKSKLKKKTKKKPPPKKIK